MEFAKHDGTKWIWCFVNEIITDKNIKSFGNMSGEERNRLFTNVLMCVCSNGVLITHQERNEVVADGEE